MSTHRLWTTRYEVGQTVWCRFWCYWRDAVVLRKRWDGRPVVRFVKSGHEMLIARQGDIQEQP